MPDTTSALLSWGTIDTQGAATISTSVAIVACALVTVGTVAVLWRSNATGPQDPTETVSPASADGGDRAMAVATTVLGLTVDRVERASEGRWIIQIGPVRLRVEGAERAVVEALAHQLDRGPVTLISAGANPQGRPRLRFATTAGSHPLAVDHLDVERISLVGEH